VPAAMAKCYNYTQKRSETNGAESKYKYQTMSWTLSDLASGSDHNDDDLFTN